MNETVYAQLMAIVGPKGGTNDPAELAICEQDWRAKFCGKASLLLKPTSVAQVSEILAFCNASHTSVVLQGGNTGLVGGQIPIGGEVILSLARLNQIRRVDALNQSIVLEAGVLLESARDVAESVGLLLPLSMASQGSCMVGGVASTNAGGVNVLRYGMARDQILGLEVVLANGERLDLLRTLRKDNTGYDLKQLFIGSEGTLGVITAVAWKLYPHPVERVTVLFAISDPERALKLLALLQAATGSQLEAFELFSRRGLELVLQHLPGTRDPFATPSPWYVLCEAGGAAGLAAAMDAPLEQVFTDGLADDAVLASSEAQRQALWKLRESMSDAERMQGPSLKHDVSVPISSVAAFLADAVPAIAHTAPDLTCIPFGHIGDGNIHFNIVATTQDAAVVLAGRSVEIARIVHDIVYRYGGSFSAEHGIGQMKRDELAHYRSADEIKAMRTLKCAFDPNNILNPGKLVPG